MGWLVFVSSFLTNDECVYVVLLEYWEKKIAKAKKHYECKQKKNNMNISDINNNISGHRCMFISI